MNIYFNPRHPASFGGATQLQKFLKGKFNAKKVNEWLREQETYTLHKPIRKRFKRNKYLVSKIDDTWQADLCDMRHLAKYNDNYKYILTIIDIFSKYAWAIPLKDKSAGTVRDAFARVFLERKPDYLMTDKGLEFVNAICKKLFKEQGIKFYTSQDPNIKCGVAERFNRSLKERMYRYFTYKNSQRYIDVLKDLVYSYNHKVHSTIKYAPADVNKANSKQVHANIYGSKQKQQTPKLDVGDYVRITKAKNLFEKGYINNWSREIFVVSKRKRKNRVVYELQDLANEPIAGLFYQIELQKVSLPKEYKIESVLRKRKKGSELYVKWVGYPEKFNSWIKKTDLV